MIHAGAMFFIETFSSNRAIVLQHQLRSRRIVRLFGAVPVAPVNYI